ncbi:MAG: hypothetical protein ABI345_07530 [Jatrophihabitans sp.]
MTRRKALGIAAAVTVVVSGTIVTITLIHTNHQRPAGRVTVGTHGTIEQGVDPGNLSVFAVPGGGSVKLPSSWMRLPPQGGDIALVGYPQPGSPAAGSALTVRAGPANALPLLKVVDVFTAQQASLHSGWRLIRKSAQQIPGMTSAELVITRYNASTSGAGVEVVAQDLIARDARGRAWHVTVLGPATEVGSRFLDAVTLSLRAT